VAVVGEAHIVVKAITTGVAEEIQRAIASASSNVRKEGQKLGESFSDGFKRGSSRGKNPFKKLFDADAAEKARQQFARLQKGGMSVQTAIGTLAGSIGSLVVSLGALIGSAGGAAASLVAVGGAAIGAGIGMKLAGMALGGVTGPMKQVGKAAGGTKKTIAELREEMQQLRFDAEEAALSEKEAALNLEKARENLARVQDLPPNSMARREAELAYQQADLSLRRAIDRNNDLQEEIQNGPKKAAGAAGTDPYAGLTKSQKDFAKTLVELKPKFDDLKEAVASGFLPILGDQIDTLFGDNYPTLLRMFTGMGAALGDATEKVFGFVNSSEGMRLFETLFKNSEGVVRDLGDVLAGALQAALKLLEAAAPITEEFTGWLVDSLDTFNKFLDKSKGNGELAEFFTNSANAAKRFGDIFGNIFSGFGALISDSVKPGSGGDDLLKWLTTATSGFANMGKDPGFSEFMDKSTANAIKMFDALGDIIGIIVGMADDPAVGQFWDTIAGAADPLKRLLENGAAAGDEMAGLIVSLTEVAAAFGDQGQLEAFFGTLRDIAKTVADFLNQEQVKQFLNFLGPVVGTMLAFGTAIKLSSFYFKALLGTFNMFAAPFKFFFAKDAATGLTKFGGMLKSVKSGLETIALKAMYAKDAIVKGFNIAKTGAINLAKGIGSVTKALVLQGIEIAKNIGKWIAQKAAVVASTIAQTAMRIATAIATGVQAAFNAVMALNPIYLIVAGVLALVAALVWFFTQTELGQEIWANFTAFLAEAWNNIVNFFVDTWNGFVTMFQTAVGAIGEFFGNAFRVVGDIFRGYINFWIGLVEGFVNFFIRGINMIIDALGTLRMDIPDWVPLVGGQTWGINIPRIPELRLPRLAEGGVVMPSAGGTIAQIAEAGRPERVEPLDENGMSKRDKELMKQMGSGVNITVNPSAGMDETELAHTVSRLLAFQMRAGGAY
jgi:hypothetical protein